MTFQLRNRATGELIGTYPEHDAAETNIRLQRAWEGWLRWSRTPLSERTLNARHCAGGGESYLKPQSIPGLSARIICESIGSNFSVQPWNLPSYA
jgi:succinate-semialdehyde dehydrogenase/glutarate-semialdehyde dehydrogenase